MPVNWSRRTFLKMTTCVLGGLPFLQKGSAHAVDARTPITNATKTGEPYELAGKRLVFTNWYYVRPGGFGWYDAQDNNVAVKGSQGPSEARFKRSDYPHGIRLVAQPARRVGPLLKCEHPWETKGTSLNTLIREPDKYRAWGTSSGEAGGGFCCLESQDGMTWTYPELGQVEIGGAKTNLIDFEEGTVFIDPSGPPEERYKWVQLSTISRETFDEYKKRRPDAWKPSADRPDAEHIYSIQGAVSPDGLHWTRLPEPLVVEHSDTQLVAYYDERLRKYVIYTRNWMVGARSPKAPDDAGLTWIGVGRRSIGRTESDTFRQFPLSDIVLWPSPDMLPSDTLYTNCKTAIPGAPDHHLMFPTIWHTSDDTTSVTVASSPDGRVWQYVPGDPVMTTPPFGEWDGGCVFARPNLIELPDGAWALPYTGYSVPHKYPRGQMKFNTGYAAWPKARLVAIEALELGEFATVGLIPPGRRLLINAVTQRAGGILVEVAGMNGQPLPGRSFDQAAPIIGDQFRTPVTWQGQDDLGHKDGEGIILRFRLDKARLFGLEFA